MIIDPLPHFLILFFIVHPPRTPLVVLLTSLISVLRPLFIYLGFLLIVFDFILELIIYIVLTHDLLFHEQVYVLQLLLFFQFLDGVVTVLDDFNLVLNFDRSPSEVFLYFVVEGAFPVCLTNRVFILIIHVALLGLRDVYLGVYL